MKGKGELSLFLWFLDWNRTGQLYLRYLEGDLALCSIGGKKE